ncbi:replication terminator protein [Gracilibacillus salitolerans]|uniref:Replication terminator protein n=1 Tax=Gracilibacillus salitolerans TaxID=2663022 RepID=A0A5Q2TQL0_9BACI|nr:replication terminator protein [Gracilibacillus salitolerans]QGH35168.1 replication terminator protein [Gracilibacillus salitolerans]
MSQNQIKLSEFQDGSLDERFNIEYRKVMDNLLNPNTDFKKARKVTITFTFNAKENRESADVSAQVSSKLVPYKEVDSTILLGRDDDGTAIGKELKSGAKGQTFFDPADENVKEDDGKVIDYRKQKQGGTK